MEIVKVTNQVYKQAWVMNWIYKIEFSFCIVILLSYVKFSTHILCSVVFTEYSPIQGRTNLYNIGCITLTIGIDQSQSLGPFV